MGVVDRIATENRCRVCTARRKGFCNDLNGLGVESFSRRSSRTMHQSGEVLLGLGQPFDRIGVVASGLLKYVIMTENGDEHVMQILRPGQVVGAVLPYDQSHAVMAATDASVCWMSKEQWSRFLARRPQHYEALLAAVVRQFQQAQNMAVRMRGRNTSQRVALWLHDQTKAARPKTTPEVRMVLSRRDLASYLDMTAETLCRALRLLEDRDAIRMPAPDHIVITDRSRLRRLAKVQREPLPADVKTQRRSKGHSPKLLPGQIASFAASQGYQGRH